MTKVFLNQIKIQLKINKSELLRFKIFNCLSEEELDFLAQRALKAEYQAGEIVLDQNAGKSSDKIFLVLSGSVVCEACPFNSTNSGSGRNILINDLIANDYGGEIKQNSYFGLSELLSENRKSWEGRVTYIAKCGDRPTKIMAVYAKDFLKAMPRNELAKLKEQQK